ncbi:type 1 glutamine amidotransferase domain-containing protein [Nocardioides lijunqiniae]|uniref:type 1 glutamine amidotransferase domain-containing protein n=1 Tax=Nocardioides lijunqiniae TaxID=2760832 RepID=UPI0018781610|nr:type 1 glutamine amidotransferase domain-containing protein [Nocardioides lijunqiniae]
MTADLTGKRIAFLLHNSGVEQPELTTPWEAFRSAGAETTLIAPEKGEVQAFTNDVEKADTFEAELAVGDASADEYDALVLPGGTTNADALRQDATAVAFVKAFADAGKPVAAICHGPWALVEADVLDGKRLTSYASLQTDIRNAGGIWVDEEAVTSTENEWTLVTSRDPDDLDAFVDAAAEAFAAG